MGTKCAPTYVTLVMAYLEIKLCKIIGEKYGEEMKQQFIRDWLRYLVDCFLDWDEKIDTVSSLLKVLQNLHPSIKLEHCASKTAVDYLDITTLYNVYSVQWGMFSTSGGYHEYIGRIP